MGLSLMCRVWFISFLYLDFISLIFIFFFISVGIAISLPAPQTQPGRSQNKKFKGGAGAKFFFDLSYAWLHWTQSNGTRNWAS